MPGVRPRGAELVERVAHALRDLTMLNETPAASSFDPKSRSGKPESASPRTLDTLLDRYEARLNRWCADVEAAVLKERKGQADANGQLPALTAKQEEFWLIDSCRGLDYRAAAEKTGLAEQSVWRMRLAAGLDPRDGEERAAS